MDKSLLIIFVKNPELGKVKTRLAATVGQEVALAIYFQLLKKTHRETSKLSVDKVVYYSQKIDRNDLWDGKEFRKEVQSGADLGQRMKQAFAQAFTEGYQRVCIIGSDCMDISQRVIEEAFAALSTHDMVIGPSEDGGYYLLGMTQLNPEVFEHKQWSTDQVFKDTIEDIKQLGLSRFELPILNDVDTEEDLQNWSGTLYPQHSLN